MSVAIIPDFVKYQIEWLRSHNDLEFEPVIEDAIIQMLKDTGKSFIDEQPDETSQFDHIAEFDRKVSISCSQENDLISRQAALKELAVYIHLIDKTMGKGLLTDDDCMEAAKSVLGEDELPAAQPATSCSEIPNGSDDTISRQAAIDALARMMPRSYTPDGSHPADEEIFRAQEVFADCIEALEILPSVQPEIIRCKDCKHFEYDHPYIIQGIPVLGHEVCNAWGDGCKTDENGYCFMAERRTDERFDRQTGGDFCNM